MNQKLVGCVIAVAIVLAGILLDSAYRRSTPAAIHTQGAIVDFERQHSKQVYPIFEFTDADGKTHRVVSSTQQGITRFAIGEAVVIAYSKYDPNKARIDTFWFDYRWTAAASIAALTIAGYLLRRR